MKSVILFLILILTNHKSIGQVQEHKCPPESKMVKSVIDGEVMYMCLTEIGVVNGKTIRYYANGKPKFEWNFEEGLNIGIWKEWNKDGNLIKVVDYGEGILVFPYQRTESFFFENGNIKNFRTYVKGVEEGRFSEWLENGIQSIEGKFKDGLKQGIWAIRLPDNKSIALITFYGGKEISRKNYPWPHKDLPQNLSQFEVIQSIIPPFKEKPKVWNEPKVGAEYIKLN